MYYKGEKCDRLETSGQKVGRGGTDETVRACRQNSARHCGGMPESTTVGQDWAG